MLLEKCHVMQAELWPAGSCCLWVRGQGQGCGQGWALGKAGHLQGHWAVLGMVL